MTTLQRFTARTIQMPRMVRIIFVILFAVNVTLLVTPVIDNLYITYFFDWNTRILPSLVSAGAGFLVYLIGWVLLIGIGKSTPQARLSTLLYFFAGVASFVLTLVLVFYGAFLVAQGG
jgi:zinc transporter ZupT